MTALERFAFTFAPDPGGIVTLAEAPQKRTCKMRFLIAGEPTIGDYRKFRMLPEDAAMCVGNAKKRLSTQPRGGIPLLFEHGWGSEGGRAGGYALDVFDDGGDIWFIVLMDEPTWAAAVDPGLNWFGRSAGFSGWTDPDGFIRPADIFEGSLTNFPAMQGLGECEPMSELEQRFSKRTAIAMQRLSSGLITPIQPLTTSPAAASDRKEREMKLSAKALQLLGFAENADPTPEQIEAALTKGAATTQDKPLTRSEMLQAFDDIRKQDREAQAADLRAEFEARDKERAIDAVLLEAEKARKLTAANREKFRAMGRTIGVDALKEVFAQFAAVAPTAPVFQPGEAQTQEVGSSIAQQCAQASERFRRQRLSAFGDQYAAQKGITAAEAIGALTATVGEQIESGVN